MTVLLTTTRSFEKALKKRTRSQQEEALEALDKFCANPAYAGLNFEKVQGRPNAYTIRVNIKLRILLYPEFDTAGRIMSAQILDIGTHDEIYRR